MKLRIKSTIVINLDSVPEHWNISRDWQEQAEKHGVKVESFSIESVSEN